MSKYKLSKLLRLAVIMGLLAYVTYAAYMHQILGGGKAPSVHALCPFGGLESLYALLFAGTLIKKIYSGTMVLLLLTVILALFFRRSFCGLLCPFGALQEGFAYLGKKIFNKRFIMPDKLDLPLRYLKYAILLLTVGMAWFYGQLWMSPYDPYTAYAHITAFSESIKEDPLAIIGFILLAVTIFGSMLYDRFFCKYLCPAGAFYGVIGKFSPTRIERNDSLCVNCNACTRVCPVNIQVDKALQVSDVECISCNKCVLACAKKGALEIKTARWAFHPTSMLIAVVGIFFGSIFIAQSTGNYQITPESLKKGQIISVSEVKGYYTIEEAATATGLTIEEVYEKLGIPKNISKNTKMKEIANEVPGFNLDQAKIKAEGAGD